jgi:hypothetical protein
VHECLEVLEIHAVVFVPVLPRQHQRPVGGVKSYAVEAIGGFGAFVLRIQASEAVSLQDLATGGIDFDEFINIPNVSVHKSIYVFQFVHVPHRVSIIIMNFHFLYLHTSYNNIYIPSTSMEGE